MISSKTKVYLILIMALMSIYCNAGPRGQPAPSHDDTTVPEDAGPRALTLRLIAGGAIVATVVVVIAIIIFCCCCRKRSGGL
jgi:hypothetical protein